MELDETDPQRWAALEAATDDYIAQPATQAKFAEAAAALGSAPAAEAAAAVPAAAAGSLRLGSRRKLVVLHAPRLAGQLASVDDGVAASLAGLPGCAAVLNLQRLVLPADAAADRPEQQAALQPAAVQTPPAAAAAVVAVAAAAPGSGVAASQTVAVAAAAQADAPADAEAAESSGAAEESGGLSAYLNSWFGSPAKQQQLAVPPAAAAAAGAPASPPANHRLGRAPAQQGSGAMHADRSSSPGSSPFRNSQTARAATLRAAAVGSSAVESSAASSEAERELAAELERQLAAALPSVGVLHLGAEALAGDGLVLRWRQRLQAVADPSGCAALAASIFVGGRPAPASLSKR